MTFTLLARDPERGLIGAATASRSLAVGNATIAIDPAVGAVASQAWTNRALRGRLLDALAAGDSAPAAVGRVPSWDGGSALRQVSALPLDGPAAAWTGERASAWAGELVDADAVAVGNLLTGPEVLDALIDEFGVLEDPVGPGDEAVGFAARLVAALAAADRAGGDRRGRQSAAVQVARIGGERTFPPELDVDLRVDDHPDPLDELARLVELRRAALLDPETPRESAEGPARS
ncbi:MAG: DUF1028 domain-containing protein [Microbacteriaceae bacterium]|nr:MAG: DUF1028 domain-containing protein [Microbacteriaceae bacterium]